ncbi:MAG: type II secretion system protein [Sulfurimonas sp.]|nr:type II secretion system protein [Sulfurimonas sp.]
MKKKAFTLVELSIVLVIIGLLVGGSFKVMKMMRERAKITEAKDSVLAAKNAVIGYAVTYPSLPDSNEFNQNLSTSKTPNHPMFYVADTNLWNPINDICAFTATSLKVNNRGSTINDVAFVVAHEGANYNMQTALIGNVVNIREADYWDDDNTTFANIDEPYDDIVEWVTLAQLHKEAGCINRPLRIVTDSLPKGIVGISYSATIIIDGNYSIPTVNSCLFLPSNGLSYSNPIISGTPTAPGTVRVDCSITADDNKHASRIFAITIDPADSNLSGGGTGLLGGSPCTLDSQCASGDCLPSDKCKN